MVPEGARCRRGWVPEAGWLPYGGGLPDGGRLPDGGGLPDEGWPLGRDWSPDGAAVSSRLVSVPVLRTQSSTIWSLRYFAAKSLVP